MVSKALKGKPGAMALVSKDSLARLNLMPIPAPLSPEELAEAAEEDKLRKEGTAMIFEIIDEHTQLIREGILAHGVGHVQLTDWVQEAMRDYREKLGHSRDPGPK